MRRHQSLLLAGPSAILLIFARKRLPRLPQLISNNSSQMIFESTIMPADGNASPDRVYLLVGHGDDSPRDVATPTFTSRDAIICCRRARFALSPPISISSSLRRIFRY